MSEQEQGGNKFELLTGLLIAVFAAVLALTDLAGGKFGDDQLVAQSEKTSAFMWYQSKSIKQTLQEGQRDLMKTLVESGSVVAGQAEALGRQIAELDKNVERYEKEKNEILKGSAGVGRENWTQKVNGELGQVIGADEWGAQAEKLDEAGNFFDVGTLFLQMCLVLGAISLIIRQAGARRIFFALMIVLGLFGTLTALYGYSLARAV